MNREGQVQQQATPSGAVSGYDAIYAGLARSPAYRRLQRAAFGAEYPEEVEPFSERHVVRAEFADADADPDASTEAAAGS